MVRIKRVYAAAAPEDGFRILVDRLWPRGLKKEEAAIDEWMKEVAPSDALRTWFSHDPAKWQEFKKRYSEELSDKAAPVERLRKKIKVEPVTLLYSAKDEEHNNALILREFLEN